MSNILPCGLCKTTYHKDRMVLNRQKGWAVCYECAKSVARIAPTNGLQVKLTKDGMVRFVERPHRVRKRADPVAKRIVPLAARKAQQQEA